jgi:type VI secretion system secreted protein VgrG
VSDTDFTFAWEGASGGLGPWQHLRVLEIRGTEGISIPYRYAITGAVLDPDPEIDPDELVGARATLRITTFTAPRFRLVHGIVTEAEELGPIAGGMQHRLVLAPPLARAAHRTRCRIFLEKTTRQIIDAVLQGDPDLKLAPGAVAEPDDGAPAQRYQTARELYTWRVSDSSRIDDAATRPYCVQYNESDLAFVSRLLEEEGIGYHFENGDGVCLLVLSDRDAGRTRLDPFAPLGPDVEARVVSTMKLGARLRPRKVSLLDYNWKNPALSMSVDEPAAPGPAELAAREYPGLYPDAPAQGQPLAAAMVDRLETEASYAVGEGYCRALSAGSIFAMEHARTRYDGEYLVTRIEVHGIQHGAGGVVIASVAAATRPYTASFECARRGKGTAIAESRFRPARSTPKPRILGTQTGFVTAAPSAAGAEIAIGGPPGAEIGCVRVRFHWDQDTARQAVEPSSCWVRVSQVFAGLGQGAVWHPRVGVEVVLDFEDGDPDRPIIVGRVYNGQNQPSTVVPTVSTFKTDTSPGGGTFNELRFDDTAGAQQIKLHTPKDWNSEVGNDRSEQITASSTSSVGTTRTESTGADRTTLVGAGNVETVGANEVITVGGNQVIGVGGDQDEGIGGDQNVSVTGSHNLGVNVDQSVAVQGQQLVEVALDRTVVVGMNLNESVTMNRRTQITLNDDLTVGGEQNVTVTKVQRSNFLADHEVSVGGDQSISVTGAQSIGVTGSQSLDATGTQELSSAQEQDFSAPVQNLGSDTLTVSATKSAGITSKEIDLAGVTTSISGKKLTISFSGDIVITGQTVSIYGSTLSLNGKQVTIGGGAEVDIQAALIKLN